MDVIAMLETLLRRWWLVALGCAIGIVCAYYFAGTAAHRYQSTVSLQLNPAATSSFLPYQTDSSAGGSNPVLVQASSYQEVLRSRTFGQVIVQQLNLAGYLLVFREIVDWSHQQGILCSIRGSAPASAPSS